MREGRTPLAANSVAKRTWLRTVTFPVVAYRSYNNANPNGGVAFVNANYDASNANDNIGSRLDSMISPRDIFQAVVMGYGLA